MAQSSAGATAAKMNYPDLSKVRIWQWQGDNYGGSLEPRFRHSAYRLQDMEIDERLFEATKCEQELGKIKNEREEKTRKLEWSEKVTWIHIPVNDMELCELSFLIAAREDSLFTTLRLLTAGGIDRAQAYL
jgi:hypothetical protein